MRYIALLGLVPALLIGSSAAGAHAYLDRATPSVGSTVGSAPGQVVLYFTQNLERRFSKVEVRSASGGRVDQGNVSVAGSVLRVGVKGGLAPGRYSVHWHVLSVDTHTTEGYFGFNVGR
jgi:methionine-rich copper-binding protein CopC